MSKGKQVYIVDGRKCEFIENYNAVFIQSCFSKNIINMYYLNTLYNKYVNIDLKHAI